MVEESAPKEVAEPGRVIPFPTLRVVGNFAHYVMIERSPIMDAGSFLRGLRSSLVELLTIANVVAFILAALVCNQIADLTRSRISDSVRAYQVRVVCGAIGIAVTVWLVHLWDKVGR